LARENDKMRTQNLRSKKARKKAPSGPAADRLGGDSCGKNGPPKMTVTTIPSTVGERLFHWKNRSGGLGRLRKKTFLWNLRRGKSWSETILIIGFWSGGTEEDGRSILV